MSDLIDRKALMDVLEITMKCDDCQYKDTIRKGRCTMPSEFVNACVAITDAPSAESKWTPVTERLPLLPELHKKPYYVDFESELYDSDWVLVCCYVRKEPVYVVSQIIYDAKCDAYEWSNLYDYAECDIDDGAVVAWMPLPEPYKGGDAE